MPKTKKEESSSSSDDSSSEEVQKQPVKGKAATPAKKEEKKPVKKQESSDDSSSSEEKPKKAAKKEEPKKAAKKVESSDDSDSSSEEAPKKPAKKEEPKKAAAPAKKAKKEESSSSADSDDESEEKPAAKNDKKRKASDDDEEEAKPAAKKAKTDAGAVTTSTEQAGAGAAEGNRLFLGNLSFKIDDDAIRAFFKDVGELTDIHWVTDKQTGKFYGTGFIAFATAEEAKKAVAKNGQNVLDRPIKIDFAQSRGERTPNKGGFEKKSFGDKPQRDARPPTPKPDGCTTVFLGNLSFQIDENAVRTHFADCGEITSIRWVERDGQFKGCGFVEFAASDSTDKAVALNGSDLMGRAVRVDFSAPKPKKEW